MVGICRGKGQTNGTKILLLSPEDLLLHISIHNSYNHKFKFHGIKAICDTAQTLIFYATEIDWDRLTHRAYEWGAQKSLYLTLRLTQEILGGVIGNGILDNLKPESCSQNIVAEAKRRIFSPEAKISPYAHMPTDFHPDNSLSKRISFTFKKIFIPPENLAALYKLPIHSKRVYLYYPIRFMSFLYKKVPQYIPLFVSLLFHKKKDVVQNDFDLWLVSREPGN
ncbi:MAG: nucleotidyltransferase family protein [Desulfobacterales bacterium]